MGEAGGEQLCRWSVKRQIFFDPRFVGFIENGGFSVLAFALCAFGRQKVPAACLAAQHFAGRRHLKAFRHRFLCFASRYRFWHKEPGM